MKKISHEWLFIMLFFFILLMLIVIFFGMKSDGFQCLRDPFIYQTEKLSDINEAQINCQCTALKVGSPRLEWNEDGYINQQQSLNISSLNFSWTGEYISG